MMVSSVRLAPLRWLSILATILTLGSLHFAAPTVAAADQPDDHLVLTDGTKITGNLAAIRSDGTLTVSGRESDLELDALWRVNRPSVRNQADPQTKIRVTLIDGSRFLVREITGDDQTFEIGPLVGQRVKLPVDVIRSVRVTEAVTNQQIQQAITAGGDSDTLFVVMNGKATQLEGFVERITANDIQFQWQDKSHSLPRKQWNGIVLAALKEAPTNSGRARLQLSDGSTFWANVQSLKDDQLQVTLTGGEQIRLPWTGIARIQFQSPRMVFVSDLEPTAVREEAIVTLPLTWKRDASVTGKTLTLGDRTFEKGIGVHARSQLTFDTGDGYDLLVATIGIDAEAQGRGDCIFVVRADGREVFRQRVQGSDPPRDIRVDIQEARQIDLLVDPGAKLDLADHANWCEVRMVRTSSE